MFIVLLTYVRPLTEVDALIADHNRFLDEHYATGLVAASGRKVPRTGGFFLMTGQDRERVMAAIERDPFHIAGVATYEIVEVVPTRTQQGLALNL
jgi:uncharacterized protein YciI